jgi:hypothetical protein
VEEDGRGWGRMEEGQEGGGGSPAGGIERRHSTALRAEIDLKPGDINKHAESVSMTIVARQEKQRIGCGSRDNT